MKKFNHLGSSVVAWLASRGLSQQPDLSDDQVLQLEECFRVFDADESGTVDIDEIMAAMKLLGLPAERKVVKEEVARLVRRRRPSSLGMPGEMDLTIEEFVELMTIFFVDKKKMTRLKNSGGSANSRRDQARRGQGAKSTVPKEGVRAAGATTDTVAAAVSSGSSGAIDSMHGGTESSLFGYDERNSNNNYSNNNNNASAVLEDDSEQAGIQLDFKLLAQALHRRNLLDAVMNSELAKVKPRTTQHQYHAMLAEDTGTPTRPSRLPVRKTGGLGNRSRAMLDADRRQAGPASGRSPSFLDALHASVPGDAFDGGQRHYDEGRNMYVPYPRDHSYYGNPRHYCCDAHATRRSQDRSEVQRPAAAAPFTTRGHGAGGGGLALRSTTFTKQPCRPLPRVLNESFGGLSAHLAAMRRDERRRQQKRNSNTRSTMAVVDTSSSSLLSLPRIDALITSSAM